MDSLDSLGKKSVDITVGLGILLAFAMNRSDPLRYRPEHHDLPTAAHLGGMSRGGRAARVSRFRV